LRTELTQLGVAERGVLRTQPGVAPARLVVVTGLSRLVRVIEAEVPGDTAHTADLGRPRDDLGLWVTFRVTDSRC
jgi:hypothetical protein